MIKIDKIEEYNRIYIPRETKNELITFNLKTPWDTDVYEVIPHYIQTTDNYYIVELALKDLIFYSGTYILELLNGNGEIFQTVDVMVNLGEELDLNGYVEHTPSEYFWFQPHTIRKGGSIIDSPHVEYVDLNGETHTVNYNNGTVSKNAFRSNYDIYSVKLVGITSIQTNAFSECTNLHKVEFIDCPYNFYQIYSGVFQGCSNLESIAIPDSVNGIGYNCFRGCNSLTSVTLPTMMSSINMSCFEGCTALKEITVPYISNGRTVMEGMFKDCTSLERVLLDATLEYLDYMSFYSTPNLIQINLDNIKYVGIEAFYSSGIKKAIMPKCEEIGDNAFEESKLEYIKLRDCTIIGEYCFNNCNNLTTIVMNEPNSIDGTAFEGCVKLNDITVCVPTEEMILTLTQNAAEQGVFRTYHDYLSLVEENIPEGWRVEEISEPIDWEK